MIGLFDGMGFKSRFSIADIQQIGPGRRGLNNAPAYPEVRLKTGEELKLADFEVDALMERPVQIMPATEGYAIVGFYHDLETYLTPIVGWALCLDGEVRPMTPYGVHRPMSFDKDRDVFIQAPGGIIYNAVQGAGIYDSVEELVEDLRDNERRRAAIAERSATEASS